MMGWKVENERNDFFFLYYKQTQVSLEKMRETFFFFFLL